MEKGLEKGIQKGEVKLFLIALDSKFGNVTNAQHEIISVASPKQIEIWMKQIFQARSVDELLLTHTS